MPTLVADRAAPKNMAVSADSPSASPTASPPAKGIATPATPTRAAVPPTSRISWRRVSSPTQKRRKTTPSSENTSSTSVELYEAEHGRPDQDAGEDLSDDRRLTNSLEELVTELGRYEDDRQIGQRAGGLAGRGDRDRRDGEI